MYCYMGVDIGTSGCKAVVFDENGEQLSAAYREYDVFSEREGWAELDIDEVIEKCFHVIRESATKVKPKIVSGIGISSQGEAFAIIDKNGKALCNAFVSSDVRAREYVTSWTREFGDDELYRITGHTPHPMFSLFKLLWVKDHMPSIWQKAYKILCFEDLLEYRLGIKNPAIGWSLAGRTMLFDVVRHCWSNDILEKAEIKTGQLSRPLPSGSVAGYVDKGIALQLNLSEHTIVVTGGHDQPCSALGAGAVKQGMAVYAAGTVECVTPAFGTPVFNEKLRKNNYCTYDHVVEGLYATVAFSLTGGNLLKWFRDEFGQKEIEIADRTKSDPFQLLLDQMPSHPSKLLVLPYFTPSGTPYFDTFVKGAILGLDLSTKRGEVLKALLEGLAFEMKLNLEILGKAGYKINKLTAIGGGAKSSVLNQLRADIIDKPITTLDITEAGCRGDAMLAKAAHFSGDIYHIVDEWVRPASTFHPQNLEFYHAKFKQFKNIYHMLKRGIYR